MSAPTYPPVLVQVLVLLTCLVPPLVPIFVINALSTNPWPVIFSLNFRVSRTSPPVCWWWHQMKQRSLHAGQWPSMLSMRRLSKKAPVRVPTMCGEVQYPWHQQRQSQPASFSWCSSRTRVFTGYTNWFTQVDLGSKTDHKWCSKPLPYQQKAYSKWLWYLSKVWSSWWSIILTRQPTKNHQHQQFQCTLYQHTVCPSPTSLHYPDKFRSLNILTTQSGAVGLGANIHHQQVSITQTLASMTMPLDLVAHQSINVDSPTEELPPQVANKWLNMETDDKGETILTSTPHCQ